MGLPHFRDPAADNCRNFDPPLLVVSSGGLREMR